jgi:hypothetical protein
MAIPPRFAGASVDSGFMQGGPESDLPQTEFSVPTAADFTGGAMVTQTPDGGAVVQAMSEALAQMEAEVVIPHDANLAEYLDDGLLGEMSSMLLSAYEDDLQSRSDWEETYTKGLDLLGVKVVERTEPFEGASGVTHPLIAESVTQFQAQAYKELLPSGGPVKTSVLGLRDAEREAQAGRVKDFMNYEITEVMEEYDPDMDQLLFYLPLSGSCFKKVYWDVGMQRPVSKFIPAQDLVVPYAATDLNTTPRATHVLRMDENEIRKMQVAGIYRDIELSAVDEAPDKVREKVDELQGTSKSYFDDSYALLEMHVNLDIEGFEDLSPEGEPTGIQLPYIVTIDKGSSKILAIRRNFEENTELAKKRQYFVHYKFMPGLGFYGFGLVHMIGGIGRATTSILRQLIDAGTLANLPAGFKARGIRVRNSDEPIKPGEFRDIDAPGGDIRNAIVPLPYKEPSATLAQLLGTLIDGGRRFISLADDQTSAMNQEAPVGTTVALLERGMKVMSAIHKRLHYAQKTEFRILARIFSENLPQEYPYDIAGAERTVFATDFDSRIDILPVSDPNIFSMAQRVTLAQTQLQLAQSAPQLHNMHAAYLRMYSALEIQNVDEILPPPPEPRPMSPVTENARILMGELAQAFPEQDHDVHIVVHLAFMKMPLVATSPAAMGVFYAHLMEHVDFKARADVQRQIRDAVEAAEARVQRGDGTPAQLMQAVRQVQQGMQDPDQMERLVAHRQREILDELLPKLLPQGQDPMSDPLVIIRMRELELKQQAEGRKAEMDKAQLMLEASNQKQRAVTDAARLELQEQVADERNEVNRERIDVQRQAARARGGAI